MCLVCFYIQLLVFNLQINFFYLPILIAEPTTNSEGAAREDDFTVSCCMF